MFEVKEEFEKNNGEVIRLRKEVGEAVGEAESMREDILESWDDIIFVAEEQQYRPVINAYMEKYQAYQTLLAELSNNTPIPQLRVRKLNFINSDSAC